MLLRACKTANCTQSSPLNQWTGYTTFEYTKEPVASTDNSVITSTSARSDIECAVLCESTNCAAMLFVPETNTCLMSASRLADFSSASVDNGAVFRRPAEEGHVQIGSRKFRIIQQRFKGNLSFARNWTEYENGFGDDTDFWLGLQTINKLTPTVLRVEAVTWSNNLYIAEYTGFTVGNASTNYRMTLVAYQNVNATHDSLTRHSGMMFSTTDRDNDASTGENCSQNRGFAGWWYKDCTDSNPNGLYYTSPVENGLRQMFWQGSGSTGALKSIRMMLLV